MATLSHTSTKYRTLSRAAAQAFNVASMLIELDIDGRPQNDARTLAFRLVREMVGEDVADQVSTALWTYLLGGGEDLDAHTVRTVHEKVLADNAEARAALS